MAACGFTGVDDVFSGVPDFLSIFSESPEPRRLIKGLGRDFEIMNCSIKRWSVGAPIQAPLQVLYELIQEHGLSARDVARILVHMPKKQLQVVDRRSMPDICVQHLLALMPADGTVTFGSSHDYRRMTDRRVRGLRRKVDVVGDTALEDGERTWRCAMEITAKDGRFLRHGTMAAKGWYTNPQTRQDMEEKALDLMGPVLGPRRTRTLLAKLWSFERIGNVRALRKLLVA